MLKGHTKIELKNEKTGEIQVVEKDNMITNAIQDMLINEYFSGSNKLTALAYTQYNKIAIDLFGGILLWEKQLTANPSEYELPEDNKCIGYTAYDISNSGTNTKLGSYNKNESGLQDDGSYKHVFDFSTSQVNGEISAISLTNCVMGKLGINETQDLIEPSQCYTNKNQSPTLYHPDSTYSNYTVTFNNGPDRLFPIFIKDEYLYSLVLYNIYKYTGYTDKYIGNNGNKLILGKTKLNKNKLHLVTNTYKGSILDNTEFIEIQMPDNFDISLFPNGSGTLTGGSTEYVCFGAIMLDQNILHLTLTNTARTKLFQVININIEDFTCNITKISTTFTVLFGTIISQYASYITYTPYSSISGTCKKNKILLLDWDSVSIYWVDLNNPDVFNVLLGTYTQLTTGLHYNNILIMGTSTIGYVLLQFTEKTINIIYAQLNPKDINCLDSSFTTYISTISGTSQTVRSFISSTDNKIFGITVSYNTCYIIEIQPPFFLTTKNNLDTPVTKTSEQSMKITYTLTEES